MSLEDAVKELFKRVERLEKREKPSKWMGLVEFCAETGYSRKTAYNLSSKREFTTRLAGGLQFLRSEVEQFLEGKTRQSLTKGRK